MICLAHGLRSGRCHCNTYINDKRTIVDVGAEGLVIKVQPQLNRSFRQCKIRCHQSSYCTVIPSTTIPDKIESIMEFFRDLLTMS